MKMIFGIIVLALDIWALANVWQAGSSTGAKVGWTLGIIIFPILGFLAWIFAGPRQARLTN